MVALAGAMIAVACNAPPVNDPPTIQWARDWPTPPSPPPPPPGGNDIEFEKLPIPLGVANARRVLTEATVYAPWGFGYRGRPMQAMAINVLLDQPEGGDVLEAIYREAKTPGRLLALCGLRSADKRRFVILAAPFRRSTENVPVYEGCTGWEETAAELVSQMDRTEVCSDIPKSKERIVAQFRRAG